MLLERHQALLAAFVDGELTSRQQRSVLKLLARSPEAQQWLKQLETDQAKLRKLPHYQAPPVLTERVMVKVKEASQSGSHIQSPVTLPFPSRWRWAVAAAAVLCAVGLGSFGFFASLEANRQQELELARKTQATEKTPPVRPVDPPLTEEALVEILSRPAPVQTMELFAAQDKKAAHKLWALDATRLGADLAPHQRLRIELPCKDGNRACVRLQEVLRKHNVTLHVEQVAQARLRKATVKTNYVIYLEDLPREDLVKILQTAGQLDAEAETQRQGDGQFGDLALASMGGPELDQLAQLFGSNSRMFLSSVGVRPQPERAVDLQGLVLPYNPVRPQPNSREVQTFLENRKASRPGTVEVLLVLRVAGS